MITERAEMQVNAGGEDDFIKLLAGARRTIMSGGCKSLSVLQAEEASAKFLLLAEWDDAGAHAAFLRSPAGVEFATAVGGLLSETPLVSYFHVVDPDAK